MRFAVLALAVTAAIVLAFGLLHGNPSTDPQHAVPASPHRITPNTDRDQTGNIQKYLDAVAKAGGGEAHLRPGKYRLKGNLVVPTGVTLTGAWKIPHHGVLESGTLLQAYAGRGKEKGQPFIRLEQSSGAKGLTIVYPEQKLSDIKPYPWTIQGRGMHCTVEGVTLVNSYQGIAMGPEWNELHVIRNVYGCVLRRGVFVDNCTDIGRIENVHFNPHYWPRSGHDGVPKNAKPNPDIAVAIHMQQHLEAFIFGRTDWQYVLNTFVFGPKIGYRFIKTANGACNGQFVGIGSDASQYGLVVEDIQAPGLLITNGEFVCFKLRDDIARERVGVLTKPTMKGVVQLTNTSFWGRFTNAVRHEGPGTLTICQANFQIWEPPQAVIDLHAGRAAVRDCVFAGKGTDVRIGPNVTRAVVADNFAAGGMKIDNRAAERAVLRDNELPG